MAKKPTARRSARTGANRRGSWVRKVAERSDAMDLPRGIFKGSPAAIARGLKRSALRSRRTKGTKFRSAMSMLNLYVNRAAQRATGAERAKVELRKLFDLEIGRAHV